MIICDLCGESKNCLQKEIEGKEYDICSECWNRFAQRLTKGERPKEGSGYGVLAGAEGFNTTRK
jgi:hypothetical protein